MKPRILIVGLIIGCVLATLCSGLPGPLFAAVKPDGKPDVGALAQGNNAFALDLYAQLAKEGGNFFCSPFSITAALAMTYAGARGQTAAQMAQTLHFVEAPAAPASAASATGASPHPALAALMKSFNAGGKSYQLAVANALWGQTGFPFRARFLKTVDRYYGAAFKQVDFRDDGRREQTRQTINRWVEDQTNQKIRELIKPRILTPLTRLVLTNAIYFKAKWATLFKVADTRELPFYLSDQETIVSSLMRLKDEFNYAEDSQAQILELPYQGGDLSMVVILPRAVGGLKKLEERFNSEQLQKWLSALTLEEVEVLLPRFKVEKDFQLNDPLEALGMTDAFDESKANFSGMTSQRGLYITKVIHKAFVDVKEEGTEAAAATAVIMGVKSAPPPAKKLVFRADHPFTFLIRDRRSGSILFMGRLSDPR